MSQNLIKKQIQTTIEYLSQNGYISFSNFLQALYLLQITNWLGRVNQINKGSAARGKQYRDVLEKREFEFATNLWNIINRYLFNYVDSVICIDFLTILLSRDPLDNVGLAEQYLNDVSKIDDIPQEELKKNRQMNDNIYVKKPWPIEKLFSEYLANFKQPVQLTRQIKGPIGQVKLIETLNEHYKHYTFKPKIWSMSKEIEKRKRLEVKQQIEVMKGSMTEDSLQQITSHSKKIYLNYIEKVNSTFDQGKASDRKFSANNVRVDRTVEATKIGNWLNRSLDQSAHNRLYNEAKYLDAKLNHKIRMHRDPDVDGCTFQPKLFTNPNKTKKLWEARVKSMESRNEMYQQSIQLVDPNRKIAKRINKIVSAASFSSPGNNIRSVRNQKKYEKSYWISSILSNTKEKQNNIQGLHIQSINENFNKLQSPQSSNKDERSEGFPRSKTPLNVFNHVIEKSSKNSKKKHMNIVKDKNGGMVLPYKHNYSGQSNEVSQGIVNNPKF